MVVAAMPKHLPKIISQQDLAQLLAAPDCKSPTRLRDRVAMELMARAGLRISEVVNLRRQDIRWETSEISVVGGKGDRDRVVPLRSESVQWLRMWDKERNGHARFFFHTIKGGQSKQMSTSSLYQAVKYYATQAGLDPARISPHILRHTCATEMLDRGLTIRDVQEYLGHSDVSTTQIYTHVSNGELREKVRRLSEQQSLDQAPSAQDLAIAQALSQLPAGAKQRLVGALLGEE